MVMAHYDRVTALGLTVVDPPAQFNPMVGIFPADYFFGRQQRSVRSLHKSWANLLRCVHFYECLHGMPASDDFVIEHCGEDLSYNGAALHISEYLKHLTHEGLLSMVRVNGARFTYCYHLTPKGIEMLCQIDEATRDERHG